MSDYLIWDAFCFVGGLFAVLILLILWQNKRFFAVFMSTLAKDQMVSMKPQKEKLFFPLNKLAKEKGPGKAKVLEIGGGSGTNFQFITTPVQWTVTEPNGNFEAYFKENVAKFGGDHEIDDLKYAVGEDLSQFKANTFDSVITTFVLCSVKDLDKVLSESKRVLKPGGIFIFYDHARAKSGTWDRFLQDFLTGSKIWPSFFDGCKLNKEFEKTFQEAGFTHHDIECYDGSTNRFNTFLFGTLKYGWATK